MRPGRILVTGASGFVGWHVCNQLSPRYQVSGTVHHHLVSIPDVQIHQTDLLENGAIEQLLADIVPDAVIHTAAIADAHACEQNPEQTRPLNVEAAVKLANACYERHIAFLFTSTDLVFDGENAPYDEASIPDPVSVYGSQKANAETSIRSNHPRAVICRFPLLFGEEAENGQSFLQDTLAAMYEGRELTLFTDEYRTPVSIDAAVQGMELALAHETPVLHLGGRERINRWDLGEMIADVFGIVDPPIKPCRQKDVSLPAPRPADVSMNSNLAFSLGFNPRSLREEFTKIASGTD